MTKFIDEDGYGRLLAATIDTVNTARRNVIRSVNSTMVLAYWEIGRHIVEFEQGGTLRAQYGEQLVERRAADLKSQYRRGFSKRNLWNMRRFYIARPIVQSLTAEFDDSESGSIVQSPPAQSPVAQRRFPLSWTQYVTLLAVKHEGARAFYETEALKHGWTVKQLKRQISTQYYDRLLASKDQAAMPARCTCT